MRLTYISLVTASLWLAGCGSSSDDPKPAENQAPKLSAIADQSITANQPDQSVGITLSDEQPGTVTLAVASDSETLLASDMLRTSGTGTGRLALITPVADESGQAMVTITATDAQGLTDATSFTLTVTPEQKSMHQFARATLDLDADDDPELINAVEFMQDADEDDFADLFEE